MNIEALTTSQNISHVTSVCSVVNAYHHCVVDVNLTF